MKELVLETTWITDDHVLYQYEAGALRHHTFNDIRPILEQLADRGHITQDMSDWKTDDWIETCAYGVYASLDLFAREYGDDHGRPLTWKDCEARGFEVIKLGSVGYWIYRPDVPNER